MVAFSKIALAAAACGSVMASPVLNLGPLVPFDVVKGVPTKWVSQGAAPATQLLRAQIGLKQSNIDKLQARLLDAATPGSKNYGKWLTKAEIDAITAPPKENIEAVKSWLSAHGITEVESPAPDWLEFTVPVAKMEKLLNTKYNTYMHQDEGRAIPRTAKYELPKELHSIIDMVTPTTAFYSKLSPGHSKHDEMAKEAIAKRQSCDTSSLSPSCLQQIYNVDYTPKGNAQVGTTEYQNVGASHSDFDMFVGQYASGTPEFKDVSVSGGSNPQAQGDLGEGNLDTQWAGALANPNPSQYISVGPEDTFSDEIANFASWLTTGSNVPGSVSSSYGDFESNYGTSYMQRVCNEFMKAGSAGISVFWSSGDSGIGGNQASDCSNGFYPVWPASCPWITAVGGTQFDGSGTAVSDESVAQFNFPNGYHGSSGGGFSNIFSTPDYQSAAVQGYQSQLNGEFSGSYTASGRGYPDVALVAVNYIIAINGQYSGEGGTSASAPAWAGLVSTLNDYRNSKGEGNLGFLNPLLYSNQTQSAFRDITQGNNYGCNQDGFPAVAGWDAATGLGSLDYASFRAMI